MTGVDRSTRRAHLGRMRRLAGEALAYYGLEDASVSLLELSQFFNTSFDVRAPDGSRFVLRVHRPSSNLERKRIRIESELWWMNRVREDLRLVVPQPVQTLGGDNLVRVSVEGSEPRYCVLFRFIEGRFLSRGLRPRHLEQAGALTARLHQYSEHLTVPPWFNRPVVDRTDQEFEDEVANRFVEQWSAEAADAIRAVIRRVRAVEEVLGDGHQTFGVIHADIHQWNYLFHQGRIRLIDFDDSGWGHYLYDLAVTMQQLVRLPRGPALRDALLAGYRHVRPLAPEHEAMVESFRMLREIQDMNFTLRLRDDPSQARFLPYIEPTLAELRRFLDSTR